MCTTTETSDGAESPTDCSQREVFLTKGEAKACNPRFTRAGYHTDSSTCFAAETDEESVVFGIQRESLKAGNYYQLCQIDAGDSLRETVIGDRSSVTAGAVLTPVDEWWEVSSTEGGEKVPQTNCTPNQVQWLREQGEARESVGDGKSETLSRVGRLQASQREFPGFKPDGTAVQNAQTVEALKEIISRLSGDSSGSSGESMCNSGEFW